MQQAIEACTHRPIFTESVIESANSTAELTVSITDSTMVGRHAQLIMFNILEPLESANGNQLTIRVGRRLIGQVGTGL